jgi:hypothetical protein
MSYTKPRKDRGEGKGQRKDKEKIGKNKGKIWTTTRRDDRLRS